MPDIRYFDRTLNRGKYFAKFDYMGVKPTLKSCEGFLSFCKDCRKNKLILPKQTLIDEERAFMAIQENNYVIEPYGWMR